MVLELTDSGLYSRTGDFHVDPWKPVDRAVVTHAHSDHARPGSSSYLTTREGEAVLRRRIGDEARIQAIDYGTAVTMNGVRVSLHPAGHILGSAQIRVEERGEVWVVSGDYKTEFDRTCTAFEPVRCHTFITEATFGLPVYRWPRQKLVFSEINTWWKSNRQNGRTSILLAYALGKAQRLLAGVDPDIGPLFAHGSVIALNEAYASSGVMLPEIEHVSSADRDRLKQGLVIAPPSARGSPWLRRFPDPALAFASGWMLIRGQRRRRSLGGFVISDHVDWPSLLASIEATGAQRILVTHGYARPVARFLRDSGMDAAVLETRFGEGDGEGENEDASIES